MPVISPNAFAPSSLANDAAGPVAAALREKVRRLERAHSAQRAGQQAVPLGVPAIDALLPEGGLLTGALHEIEAGPTPSGRVAAHDGAATGLRRPSAGPLRHAQAQRHAAVVPPSLRRVRCAALRSQRSPPGSIRRAC